MSEPSSSSVPRFFQPVTLLAGVVLGLVLLAGAGRLVIRSNWHPHFIRFHPLLTSESMYQPTIGEMQGIVRSQCRPDQILVIVGGNSIFQGVGQPVEKLWTRRLQELLGERFCVVNLAFRGSSPTDGGALVAESLRDEFPRQIYLANVPPFKAASPGGNADYFFMLLDADRKGWLLDLPARDAVIDDLLSRPDLYPEAREANRGARLDALLRFRDLWTWWSATHFFTFPTPYTPRLTNAFLPRNAFPDTEPDFEAMPFAERFAPRYFATEMAITRAASAQFYDQNAEGGWERNQFEARQFEKIASAAFPDQLKRRTLIILSRNSPYYTRRLTAAEQTRDELSFRDSIAAWQALGYQAAEYGPGFKDEDFGDRTHLTVTGGHKLAERLAPEIQAVAAKLGYANP